MRKIPICPECSKRKKAPNRSYCQPCNNKRTAAWRKENIDHHRKIQRDWCHKKKQEIVDHYGGKCSCCGEKQIEFLTFDHRFNNGTAERKHYKSQTWKIILKRGKPKDYQVLCYNCNNARSHYGVCPHKRKK